MSLPLSLAVRRSASQGSAITQTAWVVGMAVLTAIGAQIEIPHHPVPFTLQTLFVLLAGGLLGPRNAFLSMSAYLVAGLVGLPVFSQFGFGVAKFMGPTGGYLLAFPVAAFVVGSLTARRQEIWWTAMALFAGLLVIFTLGTLHLGVTYVHSWSEAFSAGFLIFSWWDVVKLAAATSILAGLQRTSVE